MAWIVRAYTARPALDAACAAIATIRPVIVRLLCLYEACAENIGLT
jgi:hypothetical protein